MTIISHHRWRQGMIAVTLIAIAFGVAASLLWFHIDAPADAPEVRTSDDRHSSGNRIEKPPLPRSDFVGSAQCRECHGAIADAYELHSMANSLWYATTAPRVEDVADNTSFSVNRNYSYTVERSQHGIFHHERLQDDEGNQLYDQSVQIDYAIGSGHQGRSYLIDRGGQMFLSPITWYSHQSRYDLSPSYQVPSHRRFERPIVSACLNCHAGHVNFIRGTDTHFASPPFSELAIGCERCHGPGGEHIRLRRQAGGNFESDPIVNPARLEAAAREDICNQCHLQGVGTYPRYGCEIGDFRPGQRLEETMIIFVNGTRAGQGATRAVSQVEQMMSSQCFQKSGGRFGCASCHRIHSPPASENLLTSYRNTCLDCHTEKPCQLDPQERILRQPDDSCVACHMPRLKASDVPHTSQTDHRILRSPEDSSPADASAEFPHIFDEGESRLRKFDVDYAKALWMADQSRKSMNGELATRAESILRRLSPQVPDDVRVWNALGTTAVVTGHFGNASQLWTRSLEIDSTQEPILDSLSNLFENSNQHHRSRPLMERLLESNPWRADLWLRYARILAAQQEWPSAIKAAEKSEALDPSGPATCQFLAHAFRQVGDLTRSQHYLKRYDTLVAIRRRYEPTGPHRNR